MGHYVVAEMVVARLSWMCSTAVKTLYCPCLFLPSQPIMHSVWSMRPLSLSPLPSLVISSVMWSETPACPVLISCCTGPKYFFCHFWHSCDGRAETGALSQCDIYLWNWEVRPPSDHFMCLVPSGFRGVSFRWGGWKIKCLNAVGIRILQPDLILTSTNMQQNELLILKHVTWTTAWNGEEQTNTATEH